jgi:hypothetical protein
LILLGNTSYFTQSFCCGVPSLTSNLRLLRQFTFSTGIGKDGIGKDKSFARIAPVERLVGSDGADAVSVSAPLTSMENRRPYRKGTRDDPAWSVSP